MKRRQEAAEEEERQRRQAEADAKAALEAQAEAARRAEASARDSADGPGSPLSGRDEAGKIKSDLMSFTEITTPIMWSLISLTPSLFYNQLTPILTFTRCALINNNRIRD